MGCASSNHRKRCHHCRQGQPPVDIPRSSSVHHPPQHSGDMLALSSSNLGSLKICYSSFGHSRIHLADFTGNLATDQSRENRQEDGFGHNKEDRDKEMQAKLMEAKVWSSMMNEKIPKIVPKTPILTPPGEPETINTWEMMDGLEDSISLVPSPRNKANGNGNVILYFTSLRGIRKTYEESCDVRTILKGIGVRVDERDVSMHSGFRDELKELLEGKFSNDVGVTLPRVFLGRKYLGGAEEIRKLNEDGKLEKVLEGCERVEENEIGNGQECEACGDIRFVPCERCSGSCKVYNEDDESGIEDRDNGFQTCPDCNENGLTRCPLCCK